MIMWIMAMMNLPSMRKNKQKQIKPLWMIWKIKLMVGMMKKSDKLLERSGSLMNGTWVRSKLASIVV